VAAFGWGLAALSSSSMPTALLFIPPTPPHTAPMQLLDEKERQFLRVALSNYTRCLCTGDGYDLRVVFRIVQLWLRWGEGDLSVAACPGAGSAQLERVFALALGAPAACP